MICKKCGNETEDEYFLCDDCFNKKNDAKTKVKIGIALSIFGVVISVFSYFSALSSGADYYYYFTGFVLLGLLILGSGLAGIQEFRDIENGKDLLKEQNKDEIDGLFCRTELSQWDNGSGIPWDLFHKANNELNNGERQRATETLMAITKQEGFESRHYLQAWYFLRELGITPEESISNKVYGVIIEASFNEGINVIAAYEDYSARFFSYSGTAVKWEHPNHMLNETIDSLMLASQRAVKQTSSWNGDRPMPPASGVTRINILTPSGLHFIEGPFIQLSKDAIGGEVITIGYELMRKLIQLKDNTPQYPRVLA